MKFVCDINDELAYRIFNIVHLPLYFAYVLVLSTAADDVLYKLFLGTNLFLIFHAILHFYFSQHPKNEFNAFSYFIIYVMGIIAGIELILSLL